MLKKINSLPSPDDTKNSLSLSENNTILVEKTRTSVNSIITGKSDKKLIIVGPCSVDFEDSILEYASFIQKLRTKYSETVEIVMRFYTAKPRTTVGWKGILHQVPGHQPNMAFGIHRSRRLALKVLDMGVPLADELLYPEITALYFDDIYSYLAVGARSSENQFHREVASGMDGISVGIKNTTSGDIKVLLESVKAVRSSTNFQMGGMFYESSGNNLGHAILRGSSSGPNADFSHLLSIYEIGKNMGIEGVPVIIDASHGNSLKDHERQPFVVKNIHSEIHDFKDDRISASLKGFMIESYLKPGRQAYNPSTADRGLSMTDKCLGTEATEELIDFISNNF